MIGRREFITLLSTFLAGTQPRFGGALFFWIKGTIGAVLPWFVGRHIISGPLAPDVVAYGPGVPPKVALGPSSLACGWLQECGR